MNNRHIFTALSLFFFFVSECLGGEETKTHDQLISEGKAFYRKGDFEHAAISWEQVLKLSDAQKDTGIYMDTVINLAGVYQSIGYHQKALSALQTALPFAEKSEDHSRKAIFLNKIADIYFTLESPEETGKYLSRALEEAQAAKDSRAMANVLINMGNVLSTDGNYTGAMELYEESLAIMEPLHEDFEMKSKALINAARTAFFAGNEELTRTVLNDALAKIKSFPDSQGKAADLVSLSLLIREIQNGLPPDSKFTLSAYQALEEAKRIADTSKDPRSAAYSYGYMGQLYEEEGRYAESLALTRSAIFFAEQGNFPEILYRWQWQAGRLFSAEGDNESAVKAYKNAIATLNPIRQELFKGYRLHQDVFNERVKPVYLGLADLLLKKAETVTDKESRELLLMEARDTMELLKTAELEDFFGDECVTAMQTEETKLERTPPHTAVLYPIPLPDSLALLLILPDSIKLKRVSAGSEDIGKTVTQYRERLQTRVNNRFLYESKQLYDWIIRPVESELAAQEVDTLIIAPDGALRLIPFSTLNDGERFMIEKYAVGTIPAIRLTDMRPFTKQNMNLLLTGLSESRQGFSALPGVPGELRDIKEIMNAKGIIQNNDYTVEALTNKFKEEPYALIHIATHGVFGGTPEESFLLTYNDKLTMNLLERVISLGKFREQKVELLTLSACQTALGNERAAMGLAGVAVKAGVKGVIATLWFVDDEATSLAIREFYRQLKTPGLSKAKAMQNVQKQLIAQRRYWHPLYWGPFLVIGNWM